MQFRVLHLSDTPWFRTVTADTSAAAAAVILARPVGACTVHHHTFQGARAATYVIPGTWVTVVWPDAP